MIHMNFTFVPTLEHISLVKLATTLWKSPLICCSFEDGDIMSVLLKFNAVFPHVPLKVSENFKQWDVIEKEFVQQIAALNLPKTISNKIYYLNKPLKGELLKWIHRIIHIYNIFSLNPLAQEMFYTELPNHNFTKEFLSSLCWTQYGTIDEKETAETIIKNENVSIVYRFRIACNYCLEYYVFNIWDKMNNITLSKDNLDITVFYESEIMAFWCYCIEINSMDDVEFCVNVYFRTEHYRPDIDKDDFMFPFEIAANQDNILATKYLFQKTPCNMKNVGLVKITADVIYSLNLDGTANALLFLLSAMTSEQQLEAFKQYSYNILKYLLDWPWQSLFIEVAEQTWMLLSPKNYYSLLCCINEKIEQGYKDYCYEQLFHKLWKLGNNPYKQYVLNMCKFSSLSTDALLKMLNIKDFKVAQGDINFETAKQK